MTFAPRYSPDGTRILFSMQQGPNTDIYVVAARGGMPQRLTAAPGIDTAPSFSPDASRIIFESDRSGAQQLYVMNADGSGQRRISFGGGWYADPVWSPDGEWIAFTRRVPGAGTRHRRHEARRKQRAATDQRARATRLRIGHRAAVSCCSTAPGPTAGPPSTACRLPAGRRAGWRLPRPDRIPTGRE